MSHNIDGVARCWGLWYYINMVKTSKKKRKPAKAGLVAVVGKKKENSLIKLIGRPPKYDSVEEVQKIIMEYLEEYNTPENPPTMTGLAMSLGLSRTGLLEYSRKDLFSNSIKRARAFVEEINERMLITKKTSPIGNIFNLKNNFGWRDDKQIVVEHKNIARIMESEVEHIEVIEGKLVEDNKDEVKFLA